LIAFDGHPQTRAQFGINRNVTRIGGRIGQIERKTMRGNPTDDVVLVFEVEG